jgi:hypothetical protein
MDAMGNFKMTVNSKFTKAVAEGASRKPLNEVVVGPIDVATIGKGLELDPTIQKMRKAGEALGARGYNSNSYGYTPLPEHSNWIGAVTGGVVDAAKTGINMGKTLVTGEVHSNAFGREHGWSVPRGQTLATMPREIYKAFQQNMASVEYPGLVNEYNSSIQQHSSKMQHSKSSCSNELH